MPISDAPPPDICGVASHATFQDLPEDVLLEILYFLDPQSIVRFWRLCRQCSGATRAFSVWSAAFKNLNQNPRGCGPRLERGITSYTALDLETIVLKMARLEENWTSASPAPVLVRNLPAVETEVVELVHGGRWFITGTDDGSGRVLYHDLEAEVITPQVLLQWVGDDPCNAIRVALGIDGESDGLSFTIAVVFSTKGAWGVPGRAKKMTIWAVNITDDGDHLAAKLLNSFDIFGHESRRGLCIYGDILLRGRKDEALAEVLDWPRCTSQMHFKTVLGSYFKLSCKAVRILPNHRALLVTNSSMFVYDLGDMAPMTPNYRPHGLAVSKPIWYYPLQERSHFTSLMASPPIHFQRNAPDTAHFLLYDGYTIRAFSFQSTMPSFEVEDVEYQVREAGHRWACLGWRRGISLKFDQVSRGMSIMNMDLYGDEDDDTSPDYVVRHQVSETKCELGLEEDLGYGMMFDEPSGVIMVLAPNGMNWSILHFA